MSDINSKVFSHGICTSGSYNTYFAFESYFERAEWIANTLPLLREKYGNIQVMEYDMYGLKVGDNCWVYGEGDDRFEIVGIHQWAPNRYGFVLDSGECEDVSKCYIRDNDDLDFFEFDDLED